MIKFVGAFGNLAFGFLFGPATELSPSLSPANVLSNLERFKLFRASETQCDSVTTADQSCGITE